VSPGRADPEIIERHLAALRGALRELRRHQGASVQSLRTDTSRRWAVERGLLLCIQNTLDIASHVASTKGHDPPTYGDSIDALVTAAVLPAEFGEQFRAVAGFRNIIVHGYLDLDLNRVAQFLGEDLEDFEIFAQHIERWLKA
jgi:uncharacterized protein YutE (UPF0331/DUF86 family)